MEIKYPWTIVWSEFIDDWISFIKKNLPPEHDLHTHKLYPGIKLNKEPVFIVDDTTGKRLLLDFKNKKRWGKTNLTTPVIRIFDADTEIEKMIERDYQKVLNQ
jgi:hypothetical protein